jgi:hypothetical protein
MKSIALWTVLPIDFGGRRKKRAATELKRSVDKE